LRPDLSRPACAARVFNVGAQCFHSSRAHGAFIILSLKMLKFTNVKFTNILCACTLKGTNVYIILVNITGLHW
jgi:hypothetical protein